MKASFYINYSDKRELRKNISMINTLDIQLKENVSILYPTLILRNFNVNANYVYIPFFDRYYYINDVIIESANRFIVQCSVDVLMSFSSQILATQQLVIRYNDINSTAVKNSVVIDDKLPISNNYEQLNFIEFKSSAWDNYYHNTFFPNTYLITTVGGGSDGNK